MTWSWHIDVNQSDEGLYLRCEVCGESMWLDREPQKFPMVIAGFVKEHDHGRSDSM